MSRLFPDFLTGLFSDQSDLSQADQFKQGACWLYLLGCGVLLTLCGCGQASTKTSADKTTGEFSNVVKAEVVSIAPFTGEKVRLILKVTNISQRDIVRAKALVTVQDAGGNSLGSKSTYLVHGQKGGLAAGASVEEDAIIDVSDKTKANGMTFQIEDIRFKE